MSSTPSQLRVEAGALRGEADVLEHAAARLRSISAEIRGQLAGFSAMSRAVWIGPAASDFERRVDEADAEVRTQADTLMTAAGDFVSEARALRARAGTLDAEAATLEAALSATMPSPTEPNLP